MSENSTDIDAQAVSAVIRTYAARLMYTEAYARKIETRCAMFTLVCGVVAVAFAAANKGFMAFGALLAGWLAGAIYRYHANNNLSAKIEREIPWN